MALRIPVRFSAIAAVLAVSLGACQGNIGSGSGLSIPQAPAPYQPGGPGQATNSRERALEGAVYLSSASPLASLPLPNVNGFGIDINLGTPGPSPSPTPTPGPPKKTPAKRAHTSAVSHHAYIVALADASPATLPSTSSQASAPAVVASALPSPAAPNSGASAAASGGVMHLSDASPSASGAPAPAGSGSVGLPGTATAAPHHHTHPAVVTGPKILTKTVAYPDDAPVAPTPEPSGAVQTFPVRKALVRGYLMPAVDVPVYGLGAVRFLVPRDELTATRGYTIAIFTAQKKHKGKLLEYDTAPTVGSDSIASSFADDPIVFKKNIGYEIVLYADPGLATPVPIPSGYPNAGNNPLPLPSGAQQQPAVGQQQQPGSQQTPIPPGYPTPYPSATFYH